MSLDTIIGYGSVSGNGNRKALFLQEFTKFRCEQLNKISIEELKQAGSILIIISTFGDGEPPENAMEFIEKLKNSEASLQNVKFSVLALGSTKFEKFCQAGKDIQELFLDKGANEVIPIHFVDASAVDKGNGEWENWATKVAKYYDMSIPDFSIQFSYTVTKSRAAEVIANPLAPRDLQIGTVISNKPITPSNYEVKMNEISIKLPKESSYKTGDYLCILPRNDPHIVSAVLEALNISYRDVYSVKCLIKRHKHHIPDKVSAAELFSQYIDLNCPLNKDVVRAFKRYSNDSELSHLLDPDNASSFESLCQKMTVADFIIKYSSMGVPPLDVLISMLPHIQTRFYSISTSELSGQDRCSIVIGLNQFVVDGKVMNGLASSFMLNVKPLAKIPVMLSEGIFTYPSDYNTKLILLCVGTGVAPILALIEHRALLIKSGKNVGRCIVFFGARHKYGYEKVVKIFKDSSVDDIFVAYSRDQDHKIYIQDLVKKNEDKVWEYLQDAQTQIFYCGPPKGISDQLKRIMIEQTASKLGIQYEEAEEVFNNHKFTVEAF